VLFSATFTTATWSFIGTQTNRTHVFQLAAIFNNVPGHRFQGIVTRGNGFTGTGIVTSGNTFTKTVIPESCIPESCFLIRQSMQTSAGSQVTAVITKGELPLTGPHWGP
jgi:hypothetical protein